MASESPPRIGVMTRDTSSDWLAFVIAAHHFVLRALPLRKHESEIALQELLEDPATRSASEPARDAVLLRCLRILDGYSTCLPSLVTRYLRRCDPRDSISRFQVCVRDLLRSLGICDPRVQQALGIIEERRGDAALTQREVALAVGVSPSTFAMQFGRLTGLTFSEYVRGHRLGVAATLLATSTLAIKEIWVAVGYNHASNFDHDFKRRFGQTPRAYRAGSRCTPSATFADCHEPVVDARPSSRPAGGRRSVWMLDGDDQTGSEERSRVRFELVTAGHHFLLRAFPLRHPDTTAALDSFVERAKRTPLSDVEMEAVLLRMLCAIDRRSGGGLPTLVDQYLAEPHHSPDCVTRFAACVRRRLKSRGIRDPRIQRVVAIIDERYVDSRLALRMVALEVGVDAAALASQFKAETGLTFTECLRRRRLDRGADLLITTNMTVKEVWAAVGYNYASNFGRDFRRRFERSPREYRARAVRGAHDPRPTVDNGDSAAPRRITARHRVLVVDDDASTQATIGNFLRLQGYDVSVASSAAEALHMIDQAPPDALLIDYHLADLDGVAALRALRQRHPESPRAALFTADWDIYNREAEIACLHVVVASKLCDLDDIDMLVTYLVN